MHGLDFSPISIHRGARRRSATSPLESDRDLTSLNYVALIPYRVSQPICRYSVITLPYLETLGHYTTLFKHVVTLVVSCELHYPI